MYSSGLDLMGAKRLRTRPTNFREARARDYEAKGGKEPGKDNAIGDCLDALFKEVVAIRNGDPMTDDFTDRLARILAVKARHPKPEE